MLTSSRLWELANSIARIPTRSGRNTCQQGSLHLIPIQSRLLGYQYRLRQTVLRALLPPVYHILLLTRCWKPEDPLSPPQLLGEKRVLCDTIPSELKC